ncbi:MAG TPA: LysR substrate-binding domain-containing protein [Sphingorhabdus sp.]|nr:LysR substrate-binding domain-containing protein [Sphingorhabdus sp.]
MLTLKQLRYFDALARIGHFGKAADACAVSQPALSMQIADLERELGTLLIERGGKRLMLTDAGRQVATRAAQILAAVRELAEGARRASDVAAGPLRLGVIPSIAPYLLPPLLPPIRERYPDLDLHLRETQTQHLVRELGEGQLDLLLLALPVEDPALETLHLFDDRFLLATSAARAITSHVRATPEMLERDRLLLLEEGHCMREQALSVCNMQRLGNLDTSGASSLSTIVQMVANGHGVTLLPEMSLDVESRQGAISVIPFAEPQPVRAIGLAWRRSSPRKAHFAELGEMIKDVAGRRETTVPA